METDASRKRNDREKQSRRLGDANSNRNSYIHPLYQAAGFCPFCALSAISGGAAMKWITLLAITALILLAAPILFG